MKRNRPLGDILKWIGEYAQLLEDMDTELVEGYYDELAKMEDRIEDIHNEVEERSNEIDEEEENEEDE